MSLDVKQSEAFRIWYSGWLTLSLRQLGEPSKKNYQILDILHQAGMNGKNLDAQTWLGPPPLPLP